MTAEPKPAWIVVDRDKRNQSLVLCAVFPISDKGYADSPQLDVRVESDRWWHRASPHPTQTLPLETREIRKTVAAFYGIQIDRCVPFQTADQLDNIITEYLSGKIAQVYYTNTQGFMDIMARLAKVFAWRWPPEANTAQAPQIHPAADALADRLHAMSRFLEQLKADRGSIDPPAADMLSMGIEHTMNRAFDVARQIRSLEQRISTVPAAKK